MARLPPIAWAGIVAFVVIALAITLGLLLGPGPQSACTPSPGTTATPAACATSSPSATSSGTTAPGTTPSVTG